MRETKFRGYYPYWEIYDDMKSGWIYGYLGFNRGDDEYVIQSVDEEHDWGEGYTVETDTIGEYTGLKDKNGKEIYEGDILKDEENMLWEVIFDEGMFKLENIHIPGRRFITEDIEIIGNIYENSELLVV